MDSVTFEILDASNAVIRTFTGSSPEYKPDPNVPRWERDGSTKPTTAQGLNSFKWDLRYPGATVFEGMIIWSGRPQRGPKAPPGTYKIRMTVGDAIQIQEFSIRMDPNLKGITDADLQEQFDLASKIVGKTSLANEAVIRIREVRKYLLAQQEGLTQTHYGERLQPFLKELAAIEEDLYQVRNQSGQDPLNFPIKLNNRLASLRRSVETGDARPTAGAYQVFNELSAELENHLNRLQTAQETHLPQINELLREHGLEEVNVEG
ncbi:MAG: hypothetical protein RLZZ241_116 [Bacteroidota bacterium]